MKKFYVMFVAFLAAFVESVQAQVTITPPLAMDDYLTAATANLTDYAVVIVSVGLGFWAVWKAYQWIWKV